MRKDSPPDLSEGAAAKQLGISRQTLARMAERGGAARGRTPSPKLRPHRLLLLDSDVLIDIQRGYAPAVEWFADLAEPPVVSGLVVMELIQDARNREQVDRARKLVAPLAVVWPSEADCNRAVAFFEQYHLSHRLGLLDALIGATALGLGATLCTFNRKHYQVVPDLVTETPYSKPERS